MTVKIISNGNRYPAGYVLQAPTTILSITSTGFIGGAGLSSLGSGSYSVVNYGTIHAYSNQTPTTDGIDLRGGGSVTNGSASDTVATIYGQSVGVLMKASATVTNYGTIAENGPLYGSGNPGRDAAIIFRGGGAIVNGGTSDTSAMIVAGGAGIVARGAAAQVVNFGTIDSQYESAYLGAGGSVTNGAAGGSGARMSGGVTIVGGPGTLTNFGDIGGQAQPRYAGVRMGPNAANVVTNGSASDLGASIFGYIGLGGGTFTNYGSLSVQPTRGFAVTGYGLPVTVANFGTLYSSASGSYLRDTGELGLRAGGVVTNGSSTDRTAQISGSVGINLFGAGTVTNFGTITGRYGNAVLLYSVNDTFVVEAYSVVHGAVLSGAGGTLELASGTGTITNLGTSGPGAIATISGAESMTFIGFNTYNIDAGSTWTLTGPDLVGPNQAMTANGALIIEGTLTSAGTLTLAGSVSGSGTLATTGGTTAIDAGAAVSVADWTVAGGVVDLNESLAYKGAFTESAGATMTVASGDRLTLAGTIGLDGTVDGAGAVSVAAATVGGLVIGGTAVLGVGGTVTQTGTVTVGDAGAGAASLMILKTGVWDIGSGSIARGAANGSRIVDYGLLIKNVGTGVSAVGVTTFDDGVIEAAAGTLDFAGRLFGTGSLKIDAGATLEADASVSNTLSAVFNGATATLALAAPKSFAATISGFAATDTIDLLKTTATGASVNGADQLVIVDGATTVATLQLIGTYTGATFNIGSDGKGGTNVTLLTAAGAPPPAAQAPSPHLLAAAMAGIAPTAGGAIGVRDPVQVQAPMLARPGTQLA